MDSDSSETNLVIITRRDRFKLYLKLYWRLLVFVITPLLFLPIVFIGEEKAYNSFYVFIVSATFWITDVLHPGIISLFSAFLYTIMGSVNFDYIHRIYVRNELLNCLSVMILMMAIERSNVHRRVAIKILLVFGCSHYRLSFLLFFGTMFFSMWLSGIIACGLIMPLVKAILLELERMGLLEMYQTIGKAKQMSERHEQKNPRPTDFTVFYFLGIAYSSSIGSMSTIIGSQTNQVFKLYCESLFPSSPKIEFPQVLLLILPGVLLMETLLYLWMNSYFLGMFRAHSEIAIEIGMTEEEVHYVKTLLVTQYQLLGRITFHESIIGALVILGCILQVSFSAADTENSLKSHSHLKTSSPSLISAFLLFITPVNLDFTKFFRRQGESREPLPTSPSKSCLNWNHFQTNMNWSVMFIIVSACTNLEALKDSGMMRHLFRPLLSLADWPAPILALIVILLCKILTEFASNPCVAYCVLPAIAQLGVSSGINPHYLMIAATLACSLPFHLVTSSPVNAMVAEYVHIPPWKMMSAGIGPTVIAVVVCWLTVTVWSRAIWLNAHQRPPWVDHNLLRGYT